MPYFYLNSAIAVNETSYCMMKYYKRFKFVISFFFLPAFFHLHQCTAVFSDVMCNNVSQIRAQHFIKYFNG